MKATKLLLTKLFQAFYLVMGAKPLDRQAPCGGP
jgi:hypothetical protein